jgi:hypothetical protein
VLKRAKRRSGRSVLAVVRESSLRAIVNADIVVGDFLDAENLDVGRFNGDAHEVGFADFRIPSDGRR